MPTKPPQRPAGLERRLPPGAVDEDAAHRLGGGGEEVSAICKLRIYVPDHAKPGLVDERGGLESLGSRFPGHFLRRQFSELIVYERQQLRGSRRVTFLRTLLAPPRAEVIEFRPRHRPRGMYELL